MAGRVFIALPIEALRPWSALGIYGATLLAICLIVLSLANGWQRGSKLALFRMIGWAPTLMIGVCRIGSSLLPGARPTESVVLFQFALALRRAGQ